MQFTVPQFIDHESPVVGPMTMKQFGMLLGGGGIVFFLYLFIGRKYFFIFIVAALFIMSLSTALAFVRVNQKTLLSVFGNIISFSFGPKLYLWKRKEVPIKMIKITKKVAGPPSKERSALNLGDRSRLNTLSKELGTR
jgi:hypothetical protein